ncbi:MAG: NUDIX domain-containing protein [Candidatus Taylorbacteria bacterium]|nr:NUDIX domain-containing protein [Candidatus Taylorbacteria bacterium]
MHTIEEHVLRHLTRYSEATFSQMKPKLIESNVFTYHLKKLITAGYIKKTKQIYSLSAKGKQFADTISHENFTPRIQPKIVTLIVLEYQNKYLLYKRDKEPFVGYVGFPYGKIHLEERVAEAAKRELIEKTGFETELVHKGDMYITAHSEVELISHMLCHIFYKKISKAEYTKSLLKLHSTSFWSEIQKNGDTKYIPGVMQILKNLAKHKGKKFFFAEYFLNV